MGPTQETTNQQQVQESTLQPEAPEDSTRLFDSNAMNTNEQSNKVTPRTSRPKSQKTLKQQEQSPQPVTPGEADKAYLFSPDHNFGAQTTDIFLATGTAAEGGNDQSNKTTPISSRPKTMKTSKQQEQSPQPVTPGEADRAYLFSPDHNFGAQTPGMTPLREGAGVSENVENINERRGRTRGKRTRKQQVPQPQTQGEDSGHLLTTDSIFGPQTSDFSKLIERAGESQNDEAQLLHNLIMEIHALHRRNKNKIEEDKGKKEEKELREEDRFLMELEDKRLDELRKYAEELYKKKRLEKYDENNLDSSKKLEARDQKPNNSTSRNDLDGGPTIIQQNEDNIGRNPSWFETSKKMIRYSTNNIRLISVYYAIIIKDIIAKPRDSIETVYKYSLRNATIFVCKTVEKVIAFFFR
ncbi:hypothetical protein O3M35_013023 [Rhynocoris fuscipes]|uniref:Uncharacterized protein n=1 Tax=Rhynocoris fuscipes TaxID=488301 RepID=A0AAW1CKI4_9HEMI